MIQRAENRSEERETLGTMRGIASLSPSKCWHPKTQNNLTKQSDRKLNSNPNQIHINSSSKRVNPFPSFAIKASKTPNSPTHNPNTPPLVVVGSANADVYVEIDRLPKEGETISAKSGETLAGGKGANQAVCGGKLSYPTYFVGQVGEDANGKLITEALEDGGVHIDHLSTVSSAPTGHAVVMLQSDGQNSIIIVGGANMSCWPEILSDEDLEVIRNAGIVLLQREIPDSVNIRVAKVWNLRKGLAFEEWQRLKYFVYGNKFYRTPVLILLSAEWRKNILVSLVSVLFSVTCRVASGAGVPVILDCGGVDAPIPPELVKFIDILSPNETELARLTGMSTESFEHISQAVVKCHEMGVKQVLVKLGDKGSALFIKGEEPIKQPIISATKVLDTTGAGDTFTAAFAVALVEGKTKKECLRFAAAAASLCVQVKGAIPSMPDRKSVLDLLGSL
ncbi:unnamed protein product [Ilex paraguariensis]|uniref:Ribokinase n=1 Tax=Ilex paraguariensis TaxID=185542 RepID=A0ABC8S3N2_9AQUA